MKARCEDEVSAHLGRPLTAAEIKQMEDNISHHLRQTQAEASANGWSTADAYREAARRAGNEVRALATKKAQREALKIDAAARISQTYEELRAVHGSGRKALGRLLEQTGDIYIKGVRQETVARLVDTIDAAEPRFFKMLENPEAIDAFVHEA